MSPVTLRVAAECMHFLKLQMMAHLPVISRFDIISFLYLAETVSIFRFNVSSQKVFLVQLCSLISQSVYQCIVIFAAQLEWCTGKQYFSLRRLNIILCNHGIKLNALVISCF